MAEPRQITYDQWDSIVITPCYAIYDANRGTSLVMLHCLWDEYFKSYVTGSDTEQCIQGWHGIMAISKIFREKFEWDEKKGEPYPRQNGMPAWRKQNLKPGTQEWIEHWKSNPEEQKSMCKHVRRKNDAG